MTNAITSLHTFCEEKNIAKRQQASITAAKQIVAENRLIVVLGVRGTRDYSKKFPSYWVYPQPSVDIRCENVCQVPQGVKPESWADTLTVLFSDIYGLLEKGECMFKEALLEAYKKTNVFDEPENSKSVTMKDLYDYLKSQNDESYIRLADRLEGYNTFRYAPRKEIHDNREVDGAKVNALIYKWESPDKNMKAFLFGSVRAAIFAERMSRKDVSPLDINIIVNDAEEVIVDDELYKMIFNLSAAHKMKICCLTSDKRKLPQFVKVNAEEILIGNPI